MRQQFYFLILLHQVQLVSRNANFCFFCCYYFSRPIPITIPDMLLLLCVQGIIYVEGFCLFIVLDK